MEFKNDLIADLVEVKIIQLQKQGVKINGGSEYNRIFEAFYELYKEIHLLKNEKSTLIVSETIKSWDNKNEHP